jgi:hypothetical protein
VTGHYGGKGPSKMKEEKELYAYVLLGRREKHYTITW